jgi:transposase
LERRLRANTVALEQPQLLNTLPGIDDTLVIAIGQEIDCILRFSRAENFASHAGQVPSVHAVGGNHSSGGLRKQSDQYLKWAVIETANGIALLHTSP